MQGEAPVGASEVVRPFPKTAYAKAAGLSAASAVQSGQASKTCRQREPADLGP